MTDEVPQENPPLSAKERAAIDKLTVADIATIDAVLLGNCFSTWRKVAMVVFRTCSALEKQFPALTYIAYTERLMLLVEKGRLESEGYLRFMRFSEVRLPASRGRKKEFSRQMKVAGKVVKRYRKTLRALAG